MVWVTRAEYVRNHTLRIAFNDGLSGEVDLHDMIFADPREIFAKLRDPDAFRRFRVAMDTIVWDNGLDLAPEYLHDLLAARA
jgi:hypothetical protein